METAAVNLCRLLKKISITKMQLPSGIYLAPMVRGSELAFRMLARRHGNANLCYSPMLRDHDVISVGASPDQFLDNELKVDNAGRTDSVEEAAHIMLRDVNQSDTENLVVQLCGSCPSKLAQATTAVLDIYSSKNGVLPFGIDLNLGCPQTPALKEGFGAFLVEQNPCAAISCVSSMRKAIDSYEYKTMKRKPTLSSKIRLLDGGVDDTIKFVGRLQSAGVDYVAIHCRQRTEKHSGGADWESGGEIVSAFSSKLPIILNGGVTNHNDALKIMEQTKCHAVMAATGYLRNHRHFQPSTKRARFEPHHLALEYLELAEKYPPPSYLYVQKHLRWIFRDKLQPESDANFDKYDWTDWRVKLWAFLVRPYLRSIEQFRMFVALYVQLSSGDMDNAPESIRHLVQDVSFGTVKKAGKIIRGQSEWRRQ